MRPQRPLALRSAPVAALLDTSQQVDFGIQATGPLSDISAVATFGTLPPEGALDARDTDLITSLASSRDAEGGLSTQFTLALTQGVAPQQPLNVSFTKRAGALPVHAEFPTDMASVGSRVSVLVTEDAHLLTLDDAPAVLGPANLLSTTPSFLNPGAPDSSHQIATTVSCPNDVMPMERVTLFQSLVQFHGIRLWDVTTPASPIELATNAVLRYGRISALEARGTLLFVVRRAGFDQQPALPQVRTLELWDTSEAHLGNPVRLGVFALDSVDASDDPVQIALHPLAPIVYVATLLTRTVQMVDVSNPWAPITAGSFSWSASPSPLERISVHGRVQASPDGRWLLVPAMSGNVYAFAVSPYTGLPLAQPSAPISTGAFAIPSAANAALPVSVPLPGGVPIVTGSQPPTPMGPGFSAAYVAPTDVAGPYDALWSTQPSSLLLTGVGAREYQQTKALPPFYDFVNTPVQLAAQGYTRVKGDTYDILEVTNRTHRAFPSLRVGSSSYQMTFELPSSSAAWVPLRRPAVAEGALPAPVASEPAATPTISSVAMGSQWEAFAGSGVNDTVTVFQRTDMWRVRQVIASPAASPEQFGAAVASWDNLLVVGAPGANGGRGRVYVYRRNAANLLFELSATLNNPNVADASATFGTALTIHSDYWSPVPGSWAFSAFLAVGAWGTSTVQLWRTTQQDGAGWVLLGAINTPPADMAGRSVSLWVDADNGWLVVGAPGVSEARRYALSGAALPVVPTVVTIPGGDFGAAVAVGRDGSAVVGGPNMASGAGTIVHLDTAFAFTDQAVGVPGDLLGAQVALWNGVAAASRGASSVLGLWDIVGGTVLANERAVPVAPGAVAQLAMSEYWIALGTPWAVLEFAPPAAPDTYTIQASTGAVTPIAAAEGSSVALGHFACVSGNLASNNATVYERVGDWALRATLSDPSITPATGWGVACAVHNRSAVVGCADVNAGYALVSDRDTAMAGYGSWTPAGILAPTLPATQPSSTNQVLDALGFGSHVSSVETYGDRLMVVGAPFATTFVAGANRLNAGAVFIFERADATLPWVQTAAFPGISGDPTDPNVGEGLGWSVTCLYDLVVAGAPRYHSNRGRIYIFAKNQATGVWSRTQWINELPVPTPNGLFGNNVSLAGDSLYVGAPNAMSVQVFRYRRNSATTFFDTVADFGAGPDDGVNLIYASPTLTPPTGVQARCVHQVAMGYGFENGGMGQAAWMQRTDFKTYDFFTIYEDGTVPGQALGRDVAAADSTFLVAAASPEVPGDNVSFRARAAYPYNLFKVPPQGIQAGQFRAGILGWFRSPEGVATDQFGYSVSPSRVAVLVGAPAGGVGGAGRVYLYVRDGGSWFLGGTLAEGAGAGDAMGAAVAQTADNLLLALAPGAGALLAWRRNTASLNGMTPMLVTAPSLTATPFNPLSKYAICAWGSFVCVLSGNQLVVLERTGDGTQLREVQAWSDADATSVALYGRALAVGRAGLNEVQLYGLVDTMSWTLATTLTGADGFGTSVAFAAAEPGYRSALAVGSTVSTRFYRQDSVYAWAPAGPAALVPGLQLLSDPSEPEGITVLATVPDSATVCFRRVEPNGTVTSYEYPSTGSGPTWMCVPGSTGLIASGSAHTLAVTTPVPHFNGLPTVAIYDACTITAEDLTPATVTPIPFSWTEFNARRVEPDGGVGVDAASRSANYLHADAVNLAAEGGLGRMTTRWNLSTLGTTVFAPVSRYSTLNVQDQGLRNPRRFESSVEGYDVTSLPSQTFPQLQSVHIRIKHPYTPPFPPSGCGGVAVREGDQVTLELNFDRPVTVDGIPTAGLLWTVLGAPVGAVPTFFAVPFVALEAGGTRAVFQFLVPFGSLPTPSTYGTVTVLQGLPIVRADDVFDNANNLLMLDLSNGVSTVLSSPCRITWSATCDVNTIGDPYVMPVREAGRVLKLTGPSGTRWMLYEHRGMGVSLEGELYEDAGAQVYWRAFHLSVGERRVSVDAESWAPSGDEALLRSLVKSSKGVTFAPNSDMIYSGLRPSAVASLRLLPGLTVHLLRYTQHRGVRSGVALEPDVSEEGVAAISDRDVDGCLVQMPTVGKGSRVSMRSVTDKFVRVDASGRMSELSRASVELRPRR